MEQKSTNIVWQQSKITPEERQRLNGHGSCVLWLTGLSGAGKSTLAHELERELYRRGVRSYVLDGDNLRHGLNSNLGFSPEDRSENIRRVGEVARLFVDAGMIAIVSLISPYRVDRDAVRGRFPAGDFHEVHVNCSVDECERRDPKGLYKKAKAGEIPNFTGVSAPYEEPLAAELVLNTEMYSTEECVDMLIQYLQGQGILA
jgi:adenylylsulfate kinase